MIVITWIYLAFTSLVTRLVPPLVVQYLPQSPRLKLLAEKIPLIALNLLLIHMLIPAFTNPCDQIAHWIQNLSIIAGLLTCLISSNNGAPIIVSIFGAIAVKVATLALLIRLASI